MFIMAIIFTPEYKSYKRVIFCPKREEQLLSTGTRPVLVFFSLTQLFATQQNHDAQVKDLFFSPKAMCLTHVKGLHNSERGESAFPYICLFTLQVTEHMKRSTGQAWWSHLFLPLLLIFCMHARAHTHTRQKEQFIFTFCVCVA